MIRVISYVQHTSTNILIFESSITHITNDLKLYPVTICSWRGSLWLCAVNKKKQNDVILKLEKFV